MRRDQAEGDGHRKHPSHEDNLGPEPEPEPKPKPDSEPDDGEEDTGSASSERPFHGLDVLGPEDFTDTDDEDDGDDDDEEDLDDEDLDDEDPYGTILITGANGNLGRKLRAAWSDTHHLILIDREADPDDPDVIVADLADLDDRWLTHFHMVDTVIHLAANPDETTPWEDLERPNLDALCNVFHASALAGVERLIFASSNHAMGGYREFGDMRITPDLPPRPDGPYGAAKLMGERIGKSLAKAFDITFIALRLGWVQRGENRPDTLPDEWSRSLWLSNGDLVRLFNCALEARLEDELFVVVNGMSNNRGMRWDLTATVERLGYAPEDDAFAEEI